VYLFFWIHFFAHRDSLCFNVLPSIVFKSHFQSVGCQAMLSTFTRSASSTITVSPCKEVTVAPLVRPSYQMILGVNISRVTFHFVVHLVFQRCPADKYIIRFRLQLNPDFSTIKLPSSASQLFRRTFSPAPRLNIILIPISTILKSSVSPNQPQPLSLSHRDKANPDRHNSAQIAHTLAVPRIQ
jgi:hypothetical protein